jgi:hypothetical protein
MVGFTSLRWGSKVDFDLQREFGRGRERRALNYPGHGAYNIASLRY